MKHLGNKGLKEAIVFGAGLTLGFILVTGGIKMLDKATGGGYIPDEFTSTQAMYGGTMNTLVADESGGYSLS